MRYRVEAAGRTDGLYAPWGGQVFRTQRSTTDGTLLLVVLPGNEVPDGFDLEWNGSSAKVVQEAEASSAFSIATHCRYDDEIYQVAPQPSGAELTLRWTGQDETRARELGLVDFTVTTAPNRLAGLWQARHDFAGNLAGRLEPGAQDQSALLLLIGRTLLRVLPAKWQRAAAQFRQVGDYAELEVRSVCDEGNGPVSVFISAPPQLSDQFTRLRAAMYQPGSGTWFQGTFTVDSALRFDFDFDANAEPNWRLAPNEGGRPNPRAFAVELTNFPREDKQVPYWLSAKAGRPLDVRFRLAKPVDAHNAGERPVVNRPSVPPGEVRGVLDYLFRSPVAVSKPGPLPDIFAPNAPPDVPHAFYTDGTWIWPASVPHYLLKHLVPPEVELIEHIRAGRFRPPYVGELLRATAEAEVEGRPYPGQTPADLPADSATARLDRGGEPGPDLRAAEALTVLHRRLAEYGVAESAYRIGEASGADDGVWWLRKTELGWEVAQSSTEEPVHFTQLEEAARFLLGTLLLYPERAAGSAEPRESADWPILALPGEPPLTFFRTKRIVVLPTGTTVRRFGNEDGNLVHPESVRFVETSLAFEREREQRSYRVQRAVWVLTGITVPWGGLSGGAVAYLLPRAIGHHLETGSLSRI